MDEGRKPDARSIDSLLDRLEVLPTPSPVAMRLISVLDSDATTIAEVVELISSDPALAARVISTCARSRNGRALRIESIERAVVLLGFDAVRAAALSVRLFETMSGFPSASSGQSGAFDVALFWRHSLTVAVMSERIAALGATASPSAAFIGGLLHDIGHLGLHAVAPRIFQSACEIAEAECGSVDVVSARKIGIDGRTAGRRIGTRWKLPEDIINAVWLVDQPIAVMQECSSPELVMAISLADAIVARDHVCISGHGSRVSAINELARTLGVEVAAIQELRTSVFEEVELRAGVLELDATPTTEILLQSISRANAVLGRFALAYRDQSARVDLCESDLERIARFHEAGPYTTIEEVIHGVGDSARALVEGSTACVIVPGPDGESAPRIRLRSEVLTKCIEFSTGMPADVACDVLSRNCLDRRGSPVRLELQEGRSAVVVIGCGPGSVPNDFEPGGSLCAAWAAAIDDALVRERAHRLSERLAEANRELAAHRETASQARASAAIGAIVSGAAHEINNPLAIVAGRSHLLAKCLDQTELGRAAAEIESAATKVADLVEALAESVAPIEVIRRELDVGELLSEACRVADSRGSGQISIKCAGALPRASLDLEHIRAVIAELLENALRVSEGEGVSLEARQAANGLRIQVSDHGPGFSARALQHAFEPFFSEQAAGRRCGLGLANARRLVEAHGGSITIRNSPRGGAEVTVSLPPAARTTLPDGLSKGGSERVT